MLSDLSALGNFGNNPYLQSANQFGLDQRFARYNDQQGNSLTGGAPNNTSLWDFIMGQGGGGLNGLPGAGGGLGVPPAGRSINGGLGQGPY